MNEIFFEIPVEHLRVAYDMLRVKADKTCWDYAEINNGYLTVTDGVRLFRAPVKQYIEGRRLMCLSDVKKVLEEFQGRDAAWVAECDLRRSLFWARKIDGTPMLELAAGVERHFLSPTERKRLFGGLTRKSKYLCLEFGETTQSYHVGHYEKDNTLPQQIWDHAIVSDSRFYDSNLLKSFCYLKSDSVGFMPLEGSLSIVLHQDKTGAIAVLAGMKLKV